jgi:iron complex outermembrane receptor protein
MRRVAALLVSAALAAAPPRAFAQQSCDVITPSQSWPAPLNRRISLRARDVSLREALDRVAAAARFRVSYSSEFLPLDRRVCVTSDSVVAGDALAELLTGVNVTTVVTSPDQVVLAPGRQVSAPRESVQTLDRVVVTGSAMGNAQRPLSVALDVIDRKQLERQSSGTLAASFDGNVAGLWLWEQSPSSLLARYGSIRGASSFGLSYPKVYIDGIEVANPLLLTDLNPASLDRIEVIRGPQGAALYGADAISGVVNIITRHEGLQAGASKTEAVSRVGLSQTAFASSAALAQSHSLSWRAGSNMRSGSLGASVNTLGGYVPEAYSRDVKLNGAFKFVTSTASITGTGRVFSKRAAAGENPLVLAFLPAPSGGMTASRDRGAEYESFEDSVRRIALTNSPTQRVGQYTFGLTSTLLSGTKWVPSFSAGVDGYQLKDVASDLGIVPTALDSALSSAEGSAHRVTFRTSMVGQFDPRPGHTLTLTFSAEHSQLQEDVRSASLVGGPASRDTSFLSNSGLIAQANYGINNAIFLTAGGRLESNDGYLQTGQRQVVALPMAGAAAVREIGGVTLKGRAAYGVGVRPARSPVDVHRLRAPLGSLDPERQSGLEVGTDVFVDRRLALHVTYFDQTASGLIQQVAISSDSRGSSGPGSGGHIINYLPQNVGEITNRGWEIESSYDLGYFSVAGAFTAVDSRVQQIARNYTGDLRPGDRMLGVPAGTASLTANWSLFGWNAGVTATRAFDWVNYDRLKLVQDYANCDSCFAQTISGAALHRYWMHYDGVTRLRASIARELRGGIGLRLTADNLTNVQRGEPDNITVLPGRTVLLGVSAKIR